MSDKTYHTLTKEFDEFDRLIRPEDRTLRAARRAHLDVRARIRNDEGIAAVHVADFLQGSYARHTMVKPPLDDYGDPTKADVDIILVTNIPPTTPPQKVLEQVKAWLEKEYGEGKAEIQSRSVKLTLEYVEVDLVPTSAPSEVQTAALQRYAEKAAQVETRSADPSDDVLDPDEVFGHSGDSDADAQWTQEPLLIPDIYAQCWQETHPLATLKFTVDKNRCCNRKFLRVARALKWWRRCAFEEGGNKHPKSYPVEHMAGDHCPENFTSMAEGLTLTFEGMRDAYEKCYPTKKPELKLRGLDKSGADVISRLTQEDFNAFYEEVCKAAALARTALKSEDRQEAAAIWRQLLGDYFKVPVTTGTTKKPTGGYIAPVAVATSPLGGRFG